MSDRAERNAAIRAEFDHGVPVKEIARRHGLSQGTVSTIARSLGAEPRSLTGEAQSERDAAVLADFQRGVHSMDIARKHGLTQSTVTRIAKEAGLTRRAPRKEITRRYRCIDCGKDEAFRPDTRCPECMVVHKRAYNAERGHPTRVQVAPRPQPDPELPPYGAMIYEDDQVQCHVCGRFFRALPTHLRGHGMSPDQYREAFQLSAKTSLLSPATRARMSQLAKERGLAELGTPIPPGGIPGRKRGQLSNLGARINVREGIASKRKE